MNARTSLGTPAQVEPKTIAEATDERARIVPEIQSTLSGHDTNEIASSSHNYLRRRAELTHRCRTLQERAGFLRRWIASKSGGTGVSPQMRALASAYKLLAKIQEEDTGSVFSEEIDACLSELEMFVPIGLINEEAKAG